MYMSHMHIINIAYMLHIAYILHTVGVLNSGTLHRAHQWDGYHIIHIIYIYTCYILYLSYILHTAYISTLLFQYLNAPKCHFHRKLTSAVGHSASLCTACGVPRSSSRRRWQTTSRWTRPASRRKCGGAARWLAVPCPPPCAERPGSAPLQISVAET